MDKPLSVFCKIFLAPLVDLLLIKKVKGKENMPSSNFILASNHQSYIDIVVCAYLCLPRKFTFIGQVDKGKGFKGFFRDFFYFLGGVIRLNRFDADSKRQVFNKAVSMLKKGYCLVIYPEGTRSKTGHVQQGKWGAAKIFLQTGVPILPLGIKGAFDVMPPGGKLNIKRIVTLNIGKPMFLEEELEKSKSMAVDSEEYNNLCVDITNKLMAEIKKLVYEN